MKKIYLIEALKAFPDDDNPWEPWYDKMFATVVIAKSEQEARLLAANRSGDEGRNAWLDKKYSRCEEVIPDESDVGVICIDFARA